MLYNERVRELREDNRYTQKDMGALLNVGQRTYSDYESGRIRIPVDCLIILAKFYNVSMDYICGVTDVRGKFPQEREKR